MPGPAIVRESWRSMTATERRHVTFMFGSILGLHVVGFVIFAVFVLPAHYQGLGIGASVLAYTLGLRHAFDADHIAVIDNTTRRELADRHGTGRPRPLAFGYFFSLGHSSVVVAMGVGIVVAEKVVFGQVVNSQSGLERFGSLFGTLVSAVFLFGIGALNLAILAGIVRVFRAMRRGEYDEAELERQLDSRGLFYRLFGRWARAISKEWQLYPVGLLFGLGFDTTTEVLLLGTTAFLALQHIAWYAILCLPVLFTAGMALMDTLDCIFMNLAYGWAFFHPVRKVYYNLAITGLSVSICFLIGGIEVLSLVSTHVPGLATAGGVWRLLRDFNLNTAGFAIVGLFVLTWAAAVLVWRFGRIEEKWGARVRSPECVGNELG
jgi:nickel/cobalt transporter (NiCoT) family protein